MIDMQELAQLIRVGGISPDVVELAERLSIRILSLLRLVTDERRETVEGSDAPLVISKEPCQLGDLDLQRTHLLTTALEVLEGVRDARNMALRVTYETLQIPLPRTMDPEAIVESLQDHAAALEGLVGKSPGGKRTTKSSSKRRGRPPGQNEESDRRISEGWASRRYTTYAEYAKELCVSPDNVRRALDRHRHREKSASSRRRRKK